MPHNDSNNDDVTDTSLIDDSTLRKKRALFALGICLDDEESESDDSDDSFSSVGSNEHLPPPPALKDQTDSPEVNEPEPPIDLIELQRPRSNIMKSKVASIQPPPPPQPNRRSSSAPQIVRPAVKPAASQQKPSLVPLAAKRRCVESAPVSSSSSTVKLVKTSGKAESSSDSKAAPKLSLQSNNTLAYLDFLKSIDEISKREAES